MNLAYRANCKKLLLIPNCNVIVFLTCRKQYRLSFTWFILSLLSLVKCKRSDPHAFSFAMVIAASVFERSVRQFLHQLNCALCEMSNCKNVVCMQQQHAAGPLLN
jgi:hypothetical protein